jgi:hypothetical protein
LRGEFVKCRANDRCHEYKSLVLTSFRHSLSEHKVVENFSSIFAMARLLHFYSRLGAFFGAEQSHNFHEELNDQAKRDGRSRQNGAG